MTNQQSVIKLKDAKIGMCLAKPVRDKDGNLLLDEGMYITSKQQIVLFLDFGIKAIFVDHTKSLVEYESEPEFKARKIEVKKEFDNPEKVVNNLKEELVVAKEFYKSSSKTIEDIMHNIRIGKAIPKQEIDNSVKEIMSSIIRNYQALLSMTTLKQYDEYTFNHSVNVMIISLSLAHHLNLPENEIISIGKGAILHDIGKAKLPISLINKPGKLSEYEFNIVKTHPELGTTICQDEKISDKIIRDIVAHHHEAYDGSGYPHALRTKDITKFAAMVSISDYYDALTTIRSYKQVIQPAEAINIIFGTANKKFDRRLVNYFIKTVGIYPVGSIVRLASKKIAIIVGFSRNDLLAPIVKILVNADNSINLDRTTVLLEEADDFIEETNPNIRLKIKIQDVL